MKRINKQKVDVLQDVKEACFLYQSFYRLYQGKFQEQNSLIMQDNRMVCLTGLQKLVLQVGEQGEREQEMAKIVVDGAWMRNLWEAQLRGVGWDAWTWNM